MNLVERHIIKKSDTRYKELDNICFLSKNLYNATLYAFRQHYFNTEEFLGYLSLNKEFVLSDNPDYRALPSKVSQATMKIVENNYKSFFALKKKGEKDAEIPKYLKKNGRFPVYFTYQAVSYKSRERYLKLSGTSVYIKTDRKAIQVRVIPKGDHIVVEIVYKANECKAKEDNGIYAGIDIGLNNLATIGFNNGKGLIINGRPLKSINQYYNKKKSELSSELERRSKSKNSKRLNRLTTKRNNKVKDYLHKASTMLVNQLISNNVCKVVIGKNDGWKKEINIGKRNNQNFVNIPHAVFIEMVCYKCKLNGIEVVLREESYTSKCSFIDNEPIKKHDSYAGRRIKRGLFRSENGTFINADLNGALNILRKEVGEFNYNPIEVCSSPKKLRIGLS
jgi:putative transposase